MGCSALQKAWQLLNLRTHPVNGHPPLYAATSHSCFCVQQSLTIKPKRKQDFPQIEQKELRHTKWVLERVRQRLFAQANYSVGKTLSYARIKLSNSQTKKLNSLESRTLLSNYAEHLSPKNAHFLTFPLLSLTPKIHL